MLKPANPTGILPVRPQPRLLFPPGQVFGTRQLRNGETAVIRRYNPIKDSEITIAILVNTEFNKIPGVNYKGIPDLTEFTHGRSDLILTVTSYGKIIGTTALRERKDLGKNIVEFRKLCVDENYSGNRLSQEMYHVGYTLAKLHGYVEGYADTTELQPKSAKLHRKEWIETAPVHRENYADLLTFKKYF